VDIGNPNVTVPKEDATPADWFDYLTTFTWGRCWADAQRRHAERTIGGSIVMASQVHREALHLLLRRPSVAQRSHTARSFRAGYRAITRSARSLGFIRL
jgi:hypothetical protein